MKSLTKFCLIIASIFVVLGIVGVAAGVSLGARPGQFLRMVRYHNDILPWSHHWDFWNDWDLADDMEDLQSDLQDDINDWKDDLQDGIDDWQDDAADWKNDMDEWGSLPAIDDIEAASGQNVDISEGNFGGAHTQKLELDLDRSAVKIYTHDEESFYIKAQNTKDYFKITEDGDTLCLTDHRGNRKKNALILEIYLPERALEKIELDLGAARLYAESLQAEKLNLDLGAGEVRIDNIKAEKADVELGAGEVQLKNLDAAEKAILGVGTGLLQVDSFTGGDVDLECGVGCLDICVQGRETDYNYTMSCGIGSIELNSRSYSGLGHEETINNNASKKITMECGIGDITLKMI